MRSAVSAFLVRSTSDATLGWVGVNGSDGFDRPKQGLLYVVVADYLACGLPASDVVQVGLGFLEVGEGDGIAVNRDAPLLSDVLKTIQVFQPLLIGWSAHP